MPIHLTLTFTGYFLLARSPHQLESDMQWDANEKTWIHFPLPTGQTVCDAVCTIQARKNVRTKAVRR